MPRVMYSPPVHVHFCGVRGSSPAPGTQFARIGGHTSCVAIAHDGAFPTLVLDAGTGLRNVSTLMGSLPFEGTIVLGHLHWDHVMGIPFFSAADRPGSRVELLLPEQGIDPVDLMARLMAPPLFPITPNDLRGDWRFSTYDAGTFEAEGFTVTARDIPHKGGRTMGLRISDGTSSIAYLSDHSPHDLGPGADGFGALHPNAVELAQGVDLLIHDAQYTPAELPARVDWGHAAAPYCLTLAKHCGVGKVVMYHHDPSRTDDQVVALHAQIANGSDACGPQFEIATEGLLIQL
jgi:phosphoribosyl 1,2-cyclic phosphodiesterase